MGPLSSVKSLLRNVTQIAPERLRLREQAEFWGRHFLPEFSLSEVRAQVVKVVQESSDTRTFRLRPNGLFQGFLPGQFVEVAVEINGTTHRRCYSLSSSPHRTLLDITVKRVPGGVVSGWMHDFLEEGHVLGLSQASGDFTLPMPAPEALLFVSAGSGITPLMSMARSLRQRRDFRNVVWVHYGRQAGDMPFAMELEQLAQAQAGLRLELAFDDASASHKRGFQVDAFQALVPDFAQRKAFVCGPEAVMDQLEALFDAHCAKSRLSRERFTPIKLATGSHTGPQKVTLTPSGKRLELSGSGSLLEQLEEAGEKPRSGCRMGICNSCTCLKRSGSVTNLLTKETSHEPDQLIKLCVSSPASALQLEL